MGNQTMHKIIQNLLNPEWWRFEWRYWRSRTPWDTQITPPEVMDYIQRTRPGRALDLGCGTGTNAITLSNHGWQTTGVDFSPTAVTTARRKAAGQKIEIDFYVGDVSDLGFLKGPYDYALDIGCLFTLQPAQQQRYVTQLSRLLRSGADYMLYAWLPRPHQGKYRGLSTQTVAALFGPSFFQSKMEIGKDGPGKSAWYWFIKN